jgi:glycosyltransferase involved in cell wall biosynthesis
MNQQLKILYVAYPLLPLSEDIAGGAEQVLLTVAREMSARGHEITVAAAAGSVVPGKLLGTGPASSRTDDFERRKAEHEGAILEHLAREEYDLIHDMSGSFWQRAGSVPGPMLATLHLPPEYYPDGSFWEVPNDLMFNGVSSSQARHFSAAAGVEGLEVITNGVNAEHFPFAELKQDYLLWLGRICEEKAPHVACDVAEQMGMPLVLAGQVYPFSYHQQYFDREVAPRLASGKITFVNPVTRAHKLELLANARALLITSCANETSSLVAMEAMACGTPVVAFRRGALPEVVKDSVTGFIADNVEGVHESLANIHTIMPLACREHVVRHFSATRMADEYARLYAELTASDSLQLSEADRAMVPQAP